MLPTNLIDADENVPEECITRIFLRKWLGTRYGPAGPDFSDSRDPIFSNSRDPNRVPKTP